jgi:hypothetical protein
MPAAPPTRNLWLERSMALLASLNLGLVLFDLTYVPWRNFWLQGKIPIPLTEQAIQIPMVMLDCPDASQEGLNRERYTRTPAVACLYDPIKGIEPHRDTSQYLRDVQALEALLATRGFTDPAVATLLGDLRSRSIEMISADPFRVANKSGTLEKIKNRMRMRVLGHRSASARQAFEQFWSPQTLTPQTWRQQLAWFNRQIAPLMATNYYRGIDESGEPINRFGLLDLPFAALFLLEFMARVVYLRWVSRRTGQRSTPLTWLDACAWRWHDVLLFFPFWLLLPGWAWLRVIPVTIRLHQARLIDLERLRGVASQNLVGNIAEEVTEAVVIQVISQAQGAIQRGDIVRWLAQQKRHNPVISNDIDELAEIAALLGKVTVQEVLPQVRPELQALIQHSIDQVLCQAPAYATLKNLPGLGLLPTQLSQRLAVEVTQGLYQALGTVAQDQTAADLARRLVADVVASFGAEVQEQQVISELQTLLVHLLEEAKLNYQAQSRAPHLAPTGPTRAIVPVSSVPVSSGVSRRD